MCVSLYLLRGSVGSVAWREGATSQPIVIVMVSTGRCADRMGDLYLVLDVGVRDRGRYRGCRWREP
jgi:hypothetical protein